MRRPGASFDNSRALRLSARIGEKGVPVVLVFTRLDGTPFALTGIPFELPVYQNETDEDPVFTLAIGDGLTIQGTDNNKLKIELTKAQSQQRAETHFWKLWDSDAEQTWINGPFAFHTGVYNGVDDDFEITTDMEVTIKVDTGSADVTATHLQDAYDASTNLYPASPLGSGSSGAIAKGDMFPLSVGGNLPGPDEVVVAVPTGSMVMALAAAPGQLGANWRIFY